MLPTSQPAPNVPQTGLIGSEQALLGGQSAALGAMSVGNTLATANLNNVANLQIPQAQLGNAPRVQSATIAAPLGISQQYTQAAGSAGFDPTKANAAIDQGVVPLTGYADQGNPANKLQADLSGANGAAAQAAAIASVQGNPYTEQMKLNAERSILQNSAATGSLGGGNVLDQLYKNSASIFAEDYQNRFNNLGVVSDRGLAAAGQIGQLRGQQAGILGNLEAGKMSADAQLQAQKMGNEASIYGQQLGLQSDLAARQFQGDLSTNQLNAELEAQRQLTQFGADTQRNAQNTQLKADAYSQLANLAQANGLNTAGLFTGTAQQVAAGRTQAGQAIAQNANQAASNISNMLAQNGVAVSDMMAKDISTVTDMIYQSGMQEKIDAQQLATILANISGGQASTVAQGYSNIGAANAAGTLGMNSAIQSGAGQLIANSGNTTATRSTTPAPQGGIIGSGTGSQYGAYA
jgi:hypothetical protein